MKVNKNFKIIAYKDMSAIDNDALKSLVEHEREVYGYEGFGEYLFCSNPDCRRMQSIDEVYGVEDSNESYIPLKELEKEGIKTPDCPECHSPSILLFDPEHFIPYLLSLFRGAYGALLINQDEEVKGSTFAYRGKLKPIFEDNMNYRESFDWEEYRRLISGVLKINVNEETDVICWNRVSIGHDFRGGKTFAKLVGTALNSHPEFDELPGVGVTRFDSALYPILNPIGFKDIKEDPYGSVAVVIEKIGTFREALNLSSEAFKKQLGSKRKEVLNWQRQFKKSIKEPIFYKNSPVLDGFQSSKEEGTKK